MRKYKGKTQEHVILNSKVGKMKNMKESKPNQGSSLARYARGCSNSWARNSQLVQSSRAGWCEQAGVTRSLLRGLRNRGCWGPCFDFSQPQRTEEDSGCWLTFPQHPGNETDITMYFPLNTHSEEVTHQSSCFHFQTLKPTELKELTQDHSTGKGAWILILGRGKNKKRSLP